MLRSIAVFLVAALASPLCCCLGASLEAAAAEVETRGVSHACCASASEDPASAELDFCPHQLAKNSQILESTQMGDLARQAEALFDRAPWTVSTVSHCGSEANGPYARLAGRSSPLTLALGAPSRLVAYCRYLI